MIPLKLDMENFLSYAAPGPLDLTGIEVACLSGANGQGKSALLDAMTWALFGAARGCEGGQNQDRLIRDGSDGARVELTFELGDDVYRVQRSRTRAGKGDLRFAVRSGDGWTSLAGESLRETEAHLASVLRMDYRTFTASAFLLQGRADDFLARMKPEDRKEVFARLLDLGVYERLEDAARARARDAEGRRRELAKRAEDLAPRVTELAEVAEALEAATAAHRDAEACVAEAEGVTEAAAREMAGLERQEALVGRERQALTELGDRVEADRRTLDSQHRELVELDALLARTEEVTEGLREAEELRAAETRAQAAATAAAEIERRRTEAEARIEAEERAIREVIARHLERAQILEREAEELAGDEKTLADVEAKLASLGDLAAAIEQIQAQLTGLREEDARLRQLLVDRERQGTELTEKLDLLAAGGGECPLCGGPLDEAHRAALRRDVGEGVEAVRAEIEAATTEQEAVRKEGRRLAEEEKRLKRSAEEVRALEGQRSALHTRLQRLPDIRSEATQLRKDAKAHERLLADGAVAAEARKVLVELDEEAAGVGYDPQAHARIRQRLEELRPYERLQGRLAEAEQRRTRLLEEHEALRGRAETGAEVLEERRRALVELEASLADADAIRARHQAAAGDLEEARRTADARGREVARLSERRETLAGDVEALDGVRDRERATADEHRRYQRLVQAFGRGGIPDRIIDNALPELTAEANAILGRLSDYEMSLAFALSRPTKAGKVRETFDVLVHHDGGVRDYQMFSGGEAFRVAFAIRMGLSKLLVRRAGARLETLVIDEGFGTQDPEGRERLVEAINLARTEFRKVLIITHLDELKDAFGTQVRVTKDPVEGSRFEIVGN